MTGNQSPADKKKGLGRALKWLAIAVGAISFAFVIVVIVSLATETAPSEPKEAAVAESGSEEEVAESVATEPESVSDLYFDELRNNWGFMSAEEWEAYIEPLAGQRVSWSGWVMDNSTPGELWIDMDAPDDADDLLEVILAIPAEDAALYSYDQEIAFEGDLVSFSDTIATLDVRLTNVAILP